MGYKCKMYCKTLKEYDKRKNIVARKGALSRIFLLVLPPATIHLCMRSVIQSLTCSVPLEVKHESKQQFNFFTKLEMLPNLEIFPDKGKIYSVACQLQNVQKNGGVLCNISVKRYTQLIPFHLTLTIFCQCLGSWVDKIPKSPLPVAPPLDLLSSLVTVSQLGRKLRTINLCACHSNLEIKAIWKLRQKIFV